jgi:hypothetical protein
MSDKAASQKTRSLGGCDENGPAAALLLSHVSIQICSFVAPCRRPILIATPLNQSRTWCTSLFGAVDRDLDKGFLVRRGLDAVAHYRNAMKLSTEYAARYLTRTLDVLHVAAALLLESKTLASFDDRQRRLAASVGLQLLPETLR